MPKTPHIEDRQVTVNGTTGHACSQTDRAAYAAPLVTDLAGQSRGLGKMGCPSKIEFRRYLAFRCLSGKWKLTLNHESRNHIAIHMENKFAEVSARKYE